MATLSAIREEAIAAHAKLREMASSNLYSKDQLCLQRQKLVDILDSFYPRLRAAEPAQKATTTASSSGAELQITAAVPTYVPAQMATPAQVTEIGIEAQAVPTQMIAPVQGAEVGTEFHCDAPTSDSAPIGSTSTVRNPCSKAMADWVHFGETPVTMADPAFAERTDTFRRNYYCNEYMKRSGDSLKLKEGEKIALADGGFSPSAQAAANANYRLITTNALGKKNNAVILLHEQEDGKYTKCAMGFDIAQERYSPDNKRVSLYLEHGHCANCPCAQDCRPKEQKKYTKVSFSVYSLPALQSEAIMLTDDCQRLADIRNGSECLMSLVKNYYKCNGYRRCELPTPPFAPSTRSSLRLFANGKGRVHHNNAYDSVS